MPGFQRVNPLGDNIIRGPARLLVAPITQAFPEKLEDVIWMPLTSGSYVPEIQTLSISGTPTGGFFTLSFLSVQTAHLAFGAAAADVQTALNDLPGIASVGGVTCSGGPMPGTPVVITFNDDGVEPLILAQSTGLTGGSTPAASVAQTQLGITQFDPMIGWSELGSTKTGVQVMHNNTESLIDVDQILTSLIAIPDNWEMTVATQFAEVSLEGIQIAWEGGPITVDTSETPNERTLNIGAPLTYVNRRLAVLHQKVVGTSSGRVRGIFVRSVTRSPQSSTLDYQKTGNQQTLPFTFRAFADTNVSDPDFRFGSIIEQLAF